MTLEVKKAVDFLPAVPVRKETKYVPYTLSRMIHGDILLSKQLIHRVESARRRNLVEFDLENENFLEYDCS